MAEGRSYSFDPQLDIRQILLEAKTRWLRPSEICEILRNYRSFHISTDPPFKPAGGSLFLFDRKALRYFRKDGHRWRKKKDGKTVREAHEKLKSGSVDVLHCYYAHGEDNENFQRRSYWMLDGHLEHIVLVHYRDVIEGTNPSCSHLLNVDSRSTYRMQGEKNSSMMYSGHLNSSKFAPQASNATSSYTADDLNGRTPSSEYEDPDSGDDYGASSHVGSVSYSGSNIALGNDGEQNNAPSSSGHVNAGVSMNIRGCNNSYNPLYGNRVGIQDMADCVNCDKIHGSSNLDGLFAGASYNDCTTPSAWSEILFEQEYPNLQEKTISFVKPNGSGDMIRNRTDSMLDIGGLVEYGMVEGYQVLPDAQKQTCMGNNSTQAQVKDGNLEKLHASYAKKQTVGDAPHVCQSPNEPHLVMTSEFKTNSGSQTTSAATHNHIDSKAEASHALKSAISDMNRGEHGDLRKLDSFGRWMDKEIGPDCDDSLMASDSGHYWNVLDTQSDGNEVSNLPHHMQLDMDLLGPSLSQEQVFSILDFSPGWAFSGTETKVLITGTFLGGIDPSSIKLGCMFGEDEVSAEVLVSNVIRCQAPVHASGRVPFYITCCDRLARSQIREFEYRENTIVRSLSPKSDWDDEIFFQVRLARMLSLGRDRKKPFCSIESCDKCSLISDLFLNLSDANEWDMLVKGSNAFQTYFTNPRDALIEKLLKGRLLEWLDTKVHEEGKGPNVLDEDGLGIIHLTAALGYEWAIIPIIASGVNSNFRDARGRTALHWAAYFGREGTVVALVRLGAAPGAVEDPTSKFPVGQTAADLASSRGHKGIAGYLAEEDLTSHLSALDLEESIMDSVSANLAAERAIEGIQKQNATPLEKNNEVQSTIRGSLAAVRNSAQAAARIHAAFRFQSFRRRQIMESNNGDLEITNEVMMLPSLNNKAPKMTHFNDSLHTAAIKIQQKYRGYVGRRDFLKIRNRVVKIQAHFRGHRVRKQYKKVVWSVGIVEKAILRWRRKGAGLRGFRAGKPIEPVGLGTGRADEYDFLHHGRKQKFAGVEKALARVQSMARRPEARDQYMRLLASSHKSKLGDGGQYAQGLEQERESEDGLLATMIS